MAQRMTDLAIVRCSKRAKELTREMIEGISGPPEQGYAGEIVEYMSIAPDCWFAVLAQRGSAENFRRGVDGKGRIALFCGVLFDTNGTCPAPEVRLLDAAENSGLDQVSNWNGSFAAAVYDPTSAELTLLSDRLATRPLFIHSKANQVIASTRLDALAKCSTVPHRLSAQGMTELITYQRTICDQTQYADIKSTPAASVWTFADGKDRRRQSRRLKWHNPDFPQSEGGERLATALTAAAKRRIPSEGAGMLMSGGFDSRLVLAAARKAGRVLRCYTSTPATTPNLELRIAEASANAANMQFNAIYSPPSELADWLDPCVRASHGLFSPPTNLFGAMAKVEAQEKVVLSGHGLDYTLRGYYLPCRSLSILGTTTRLPSLRPIRDGSPFEVDEALRVGISRDALLRCLTPPFAKQWRERRLLAMQAARGQADIQNPYDAWDAYILHALGRHYAWSDFAAMGSRVDHRTLAFDREVIDFYFSMPPSWRASGRIARDAMRILAPDLLELPDANSGFKAKYDPRFQIGLILGRAAFRRIGLVQKAKDESIYTGQGSWPKYGALFKHCPRFVARLTALKNDDALFDTGVFNREGISSTIDEHLSGTRSHQKLLLQVLSLSSWLCQFGFSGVVDD